MAHMMDDGKTRQVLDVIPSSTPDQQRQAVRAVLTHGSSVRDAYLMLSILGLLDVAHAMRDHDPCTCYGGHRCLNHDDEGANP